MNKRDGEQVGGETMEMVAWSGYSNSMDMVRIDRSQMERSLVTIYSALNHGPVRDFVCSPGAPGFREKGGSVILSHGDVLPVMG